MIVFAYLFMSLLFIKSDVGCCLVLLFTFIIELIPNVFYIVIILYEKILKICFFTISIFRKNLISQFSVHFMIIFLSFLIFRFDIFL